MPTTEKVITIGHMTMGISSILSEANYQHSVDMYNSNAPFGLEFTGKDSLDGLRVAVGPEIFWN